jgi:voltage-gated potassium channel Kch
VRLRQEPLAPGKPRRLLAWLSLATDRRPRTHARPRLFLALILVTLALGTWGFRELAFPDRLSLLQSVYRAARLYTLEVAPVDGSGSSTVGPNWQIVAAFALAAMLVIRALVALAGGLIRRVVTRRLLSGHVIVCGAGVHGAHLARALSQKHDVVLMDPDPGAPGMRGSPSKHEWRIVADAVGPDALLAAGAPRANCVVAVTGDDFTNSQVVSALLALRGLKDGLHVLVQVEDPGLARFLEDTDPGEAADRSRERERAVVTTFSPNAIAADLLLDRVRRKLPGGEEGSLIADAGAPYVILAGDHPLLDAIVLAALRRWRVRLLRGLEQPSGRQPTPMRIGIYGPDACARVERLRRRWLPEPAVLELEAKDSELTGAVSASEATWLVQRRHAAHAFLACTNELDGVELSLGLSRLLGTGVLLTRVTTQPASLLDERLRIRNAEDPQLATTEILPIDELAYDRRAMTEISAPERLVRALEEVDLGEPDARRMSAELFARDRLGIHSDPMWRVVAGEGALARPLVAPVPISAMVRACLSIDLEAPGNLRAAAEALGREGRPREAFTAWCEYARHVTAACPESERAGLRRASGEELADTVLRMRASTLGTGERPADGGAASGVLAGAKRVTIFAGAATAMTATSEGLLRPILLRALDGYDDIVLCGATATGPASLIGATARKLGLHVVGYASADRGGRGLYASPRETSGTGEFGVRESVRMWCDIFAAGIRVEDVRVVACAGASLTQADSGWITQAEILLARAIGAPVAWLDPTGEALTTLDDALPFGAGGVLELPADAMTLRAFFRWSSAPEDLSYDLCARVARYLHADYRRRHRGRKPPGDAALAPWDQLLPALQRSNLDQAGDIPNKLAVIGKQLDRSGERLQLDRRQVELLAEIEHGRWNVERLRGGWQLGEREVSRLVSSYLKPWQDLDDEAKEFDREAVRNIAPALADAGWGVVGSLRRV